jgi:hypothetical protein
MAEKGASTCVRIGKSSRRAAAPDRQAVEIKPSALIVVGLFHVYVYFRAMKNPTGKRNL